MEEMAEGEAMTENEGMAEGEGMMQEMALPDTMGAAVWSHLEAADYSANWELWPGKGELYTGQEPHGALLTTYLNPVAYAALTGMAGSMPAGAIIVKENYMPDSTLAAITVMYKLVLGQAARRWHDRGTGPRRGLHRLSRRPAGQRLHLHGVTERPDVGPCATAPRQ
jgi:hypothetical protein